MQSHAGVHQGPSRMVVEGTTSAFESVMDTSSYHSSPLASEYDGAPQTVLQELCLSLLSLFVQVD